MDGDAFLYSVTLFTFIAIFFLCYIQKKFTFLEKNKMSRASNPKFPFGNVHDVVFQEIPMFMHLWKYYNKFKKKKCKTGGFYVFLKPAVLIVNSELTDTVLSHNSHHLQEWRDRRISDFNDELGNNILNDIVKGFLTSWPSLTQSITTEEVNVTDVMNHYTVEVSLSKLFCAEAKDDDLRRILQKELQENKFSNLFKLLDMSYGYSCNRYKKFAEVVGNVVNERKKDDAKKGDVLELLLEKDRSTAEIVEVMYNLAWNLKISVNLMLLLLYELSLNEDIQEDLRGEILRFRKGNKITDFADLNELAYLETVIRETLRKYPVEPFVCKKCTKNYNQNGLKFSEDILLFVSIFGIHHDPQNYTNPELFDPDRFAEENEKFFISSKYLPFGRKNKNDFDSKFIVIMMKLMVMDLLTNIKVSLGKKSPKSLKFDEASFRLKPKEDMWLKIDKI